MGADTVDWARLVDGLEALRAEVARLGARVAALELAAASGGVHPRRAEAGGSPEAEGLNEELLLVISAAVAAFLGKRPRIRQVRLLGSAAWAQQGRVTIQASHALAVHHGRSQQ
jgi:methylmalonyl-CoA carboxyltransferase large subunit